MTIQIPASEASARVIQAILDLEKRINAASAGTVRPPLRRLEDGSIALQEADLLQALAALSVVFEVDDQGQLSFSQEAVSAPLTVDGVTGKLGLHLGSALAVAGDGGLYVVPAAALADTAGLTLLQLETEVNTFKQRLRDAALLEP